MAKVAVDITTCNQCANSQVQNISGPDEHVRTGYVCPGLNNRVLFFIGQEPSPVPSDCPRLLHTEEQMHIKVNLPRKTPPYHTINWHPYETT